MATVAEKEYRVLVIQYLAIVARYNPQMLYQDKLQAAKIFAELDLKKKYPGLAIQ